MNSVDTSRSTPHSYTNSYMTESSKYAGLIQASRAKRMLRSVQNLLNYMDSIIPEMYTMHNIVSVWRAVQMFGLMLLTNYESIYSPEGVIHKFFNYFSIIWNLVPIDNRDRGAFLLAFFYFLITAAFFITIFSSANYYAKKGSLHKIVIYSIHIYISIFGYLIHVPCLEICFETISRLIVKKETHSSLPHCIFALVLTLIAYLSYYFFYRNVYSYSFLFRPTSFMCINGVQQMATFQIQTFQAILIGIATYLPAIPQAIFLFIDAIICLTVYFSVYKSFSMVHFWHNTVFLTFTIFGFISHALFGVVVIVEAENTPVGLFVWIFALVICFILSHFITHTIIRQALLYLDNICEDPSILDNETNYIKLYIYNIIGYHFAHPASLDFRVFKYLTTKNPDNGLYWVVYGKFVAIYPELSELHSFIVRTLIQRKISTRFAKQCVAQSHIIFQQRDSNLSADLKKKLSILTKETSGAKRRLRHIWDQVIQGNMAEMDGAITNAYHSIDNCEVQFNLMLVQVPNNRFLYRAYSSYLLECANDIERYKDASDKTKMLSRGLRVCPDHTQELGLHAFPNLPLFLPVSYSLGVSGQNDMSESTVFQEDLDEETITKREEDSRSLKTMISEISIPSIKFTYITAAILCICSIVLISILLPLLIPFKRRIKKPQTFSEYTSRARYYAAISTVLAHLYMISSAGTLKMKEYHMTSFNDGNTTLEHLQFTVTQLINEVQHFADFRDYKIGNEYMDHTRYLLYNDSTRFIQYNTKLQYTVTNQSLSYILSQYILRLTEVTEIDSRQIARTPQKYLQSPSLINPMINIETVVDQLAYITDNLTGYIDSQVTRMDNIMYWDRIGGSITLTLIFLIIMILIWVKISRDKVIIYKTLMVLPKNVVSQISESLRSVKADESMKSERFGSMAHMGQELERNRQEENTLKVLTAASDESKLSSELYIILTLFIVFCSLAIIVNVFISILYTKEGNAINENCQHVDNIYTTASFMALLCMEANDITAMLSGLNSDSSDPFAKWLHLKIYNNNLTDYYSALRFGYEKGKPFPTFTDLVDLSLERAKCNKTKIPASLKEGFNCLSPDVLIRYEYFFLHSILDYPVISASRKIIIAIDTARLIYANELYLYRIYDDFLYQAALVVDGLVEEQSSKNFPIWGTLSIFGGIGIVICAILIAVSAHSLEKKLRFTLQLLLACQTQMVMQNSYIVSVLSGNFSKGGKDSSTRDDAFYDTLVAELPDAIIVTNGATYKVSSINNAAQKIFQTDLVGESFHAYITSNEFSPESKVKIETLFDPTTKTASCGVTNLKGEPDVRNLLVTRTSVLVGDSVIFTVRNVTQTFVYNKLICEERAKSDKMLATILPATLVPRVQAGEKNISFAVPAATICFIDIVEFTPWCSSNSAQVVTGTLNDIFTEFDTIVGSLQVMERVKCIGDCYMCAGGIFAETPNILQFARSTVDFGLEAIEAIGRVNERNGQSLRVRVGVHIGGPIVAGVIGIGKPTFEIFGPAISMAQQMEHNGVAMRVHVSRNVYELIYGGTYKIEERGEIQCKQGKMVTYLVDKLEK